ncbi:MAG: LptF/LptG family permease [Alphaproteobacteria bacterium]|nr:LptF/LptG family permease [Alphaproteobacteria bacterium]
MIRQIIVATVFVSVVLLAFVTVVQSLGLVEFVINRGLPAAVVFELLALRAPAIMMTVLPIAFFGAMLFIYNKLQGESELVIMRTVGMSDLNLARPAFVVTLIAMGAAYANGLYLMPVSFSTFKNHEFEYRNANGSMSLQAGKFNTPTDTVTVYVRERIGASDLRGILIRDARDAENPLTILAERGVLRMANEIPRLVLYDGTRQEIDSETGQLTLLYFNQYSVDFDLDQPSAQDRFRGPKERTIDELFHPGNSPSELQHHDNLVAEGHRRLIDPFSLPAMAIIALALLLPGEHVRRGSALRILSAVVIAVTYQAVLIGLVAAVSKSLALAPLFYVLPISVIAIGGAVVWRGPPRRNFRTSVGSGPTIGIGAG